MEPFDVGLVSLLRPGQGLVPSHLWIAKAHRVAHCVPVSDCGNSIFFFDLV